MKKLMRVVLIVAFGLVVVAGLAVAALALRRPAQRPPSAERIELTPERFARGAYLVEHLADCLTCHSDLRADRYGMPIKPGTIGQGGFPFGKEFAVPGVVCAQNITPDPENGIGTWTDGEVLRAVREGVDKNGNALFPMMQYKAYRLFSDEDAKSVVAYIRTLAPVKHAVPARNPRVAPRPEDGPHRIRALPRGRGRMPRMPHPARRQGEAPAEEGLLGRLGDERAVGAQHHAQSHAPCRCVPRPGHESRVHRALQILRLAHGRQRTGRAERPQHHHALAAFLGPHRGRPRDALRLLQDPRADREQDEPFPGRRAGASGAEGQS